MSKWVSVWIALLFRLSVLLRLPSLLVSPAIAVRKSWWTDETYGGNLLGCFYRLHVCVSVPICLKLRRKQTASLWNIHFLFRSRFHVDVAVKRGRPVHTITGSTPPPPPKKQLMFPSTAIMSKNLTTAESLSSQVSPDESINAAPNICYNIRCQVDISFSTVRVRPRWKKMSAYALRNACL